MPSRRPADPPNARRKPLRKCDFPTLVHERYLGAPDSLQCGKEPGQNHRETSSDIASLRTKGERTIQV